MKKTLFPLLILLSILLSCSNEASDLSKSGLKGKVKSIKELHFESTHEGDRWVAGNPAIYGGHIVDYNENGQFMQSYSINSAGDTLGISSCKRENGFIVEENYRSLINNNNSRTLYEKVSDEEVHFELWQNDLLLYEGANYLDGKGRLLRQAQVSNGRESNVYHVYEKGLLVESYQEDMEGERMETRLYEYDEFDANGNWTIKLIYMGDEKITPKLVMTREITYY